MCSARRSRPEPLFRLAKTVSGPLQRASMHQLCSLDRYLGVINLLTRFAERPANGIPVRHNRGWLSRDFSSCSGYVSWAYTLARIPAGRAASFLYLVPGVTLGGAIAISGVVMVNLFGRIQTEQI